MSVLFVVGSPRSGTSMLSRLLSAHPDVVLFNELRFTELAAIAGVLIGTGGADPGGSGQADPTQMAIGTSFVRELIAFWRARGHAWVGDKFPPYSLEVDLLETLYPGARYIHIIRDGRDVVSSMQVAHRARKAWRRGPTPPAFVLSVGTWVRFVTAARAAGETLGPRYLEVRYEDILDQEDRFVSAVCDFLDLDVQPAFSEALGGAVRRRHWSESLTEAEKSAFAGVKVAEDLLAELGYPPTTWDPEAVGTPALTLAQQATEAGETRRAADHLARALVAPGADVEPARTLLRTHPGSPESVFGAMHLRGSAQAKDRALLASWLTARGLDPAAAAALFRGES